MRHPAPGRSQSAGQTPLFFNYSYLKTNKKNTLLTAKKHRDSRCLRQTGERAPAPVISLLGGFAPRISMFRSPEETRLSPAGARRAERLPRPPLALGTASLPWLEGKRAERRASAERTSGERLPRRTPSRGRGAGPAPPPQPLPGLISRRCLARGRWRTGPGTEPL